LKNFSRRFNSNLTWFIPSTKQEITKGHLPYLMK
jgi:hypothetical protein